MRCGVTRARKPKVEVIGQTGAKAYKLPAWIGGPLGWLTDAWAVARNRRKIYIGFAAAVFVWGYTPTATHHMKQDVYAEVCAKARNAFRMSSLSQCGSTTIASEAVAFEQIRLLGDKRLASKPLTSFPVLYDGQQISLGEHPSYQRLVRTQCFEDVVYSQLIAVNWMHCNAEAPTRPDQHVMRAAHSVVQASAEAYRDWRALEAIYSPPVDEVDEVLMAER